MINIKRFSAIQKTIIKLSKDIKSLKYHKGPYNKYIHMDIRYILEKMIVCGEELEKHNTEYIQSKKDLSYYYCNNFKDNIKFSLDGKRRIYKPDKNKDNEQPEKQEKQEDELNNISRIDEQDLNEIEELEKSLYSTKKNK